jgi:imidazolonepropionase-like amidohydrolase
MRIGLAILVLAGSFAAPPKDDLLAVKAGRIITVSGEEIVDGVILIRDGKIEAVGKGLEVPWDAKVLDVGKQVVVPGFVETHSSRGVDRANENVPSVAVREHAFDSVNPLDPYFEGRVPAGHHDHVRGAGNGTMIGGQGCVLKPVGTITEAMTLVKNHALKLSLEPRSGMSRMAHLAALRRELDEVIDYLKEIDEKRKEVPTAAGGAPAGPAPEMEIKREVMAKFLQGKLAAFVYCPTASDVLRAIELSKKYKFKMKLVLGRDTWKAADDIAREKLEVILPADMIFWETDEEKHEEVLRVLPAIFAKAGVKFAFQTEASSTGSGYLWYQAAAAVRHGLPRADAIRAVTRTPAEILGLDARFGTIEKGRDANLVVLTGDPLDARTWVDQVLVEGKIVYERSKDTKLKRILGAEK